ncbi:MAG TPA: hypothetical protein VJH24_06040 [Candidatus Bilamarchaeaceae archaeon]|nr:hypothetical protein [Candidatus Bilamarchaeaceae archaeon]
MADEKYGEWAFLLGVLIAVVLGLFASQVQGQETLIFGLLALLGLVVGLLNISEKEINSFLIAAIALAILPGALSAIYSILPALENPLSRFVTAIGVFVAPAAFIVALKAIYVLASKK